jgi:hypothetical protein
LNELELIVGKIIGYESSPELSDPDWFRRACLVGDPYASGYSTVLVQQWIKDRLRSHHAYTEIDTVFESPFVDQMQPAIDKGGTILSYRGYYGMSGWTNSHTYALQNGWKLPFVVTITCGTGSFAYGTSRSEAFLRASGVPGFPRGGIASIGTATVGTHTRYNNCIHYGIFRGLLWEDQYTLGAALTRGKLEMYLNYQTSQPNQVLIWSYWNNLMGDPAVECWTGFPEELTVTHPGQVPVGTNAVRINVEQLGIPEPDAQVCLLKDGETHSVGVTDALGQIELPVTVEAGGEVLVTVTKHNRHPYMATVAIVAEEVFVGYVDSEVDDDTEGESLGDGNGVANPGETIELRVQLQNHGTEIAGGVEALLTCTDPYVTVLDNEETFGDLEGGATAWSFDDFVFGIDPRCPHGHLVRLGLDVSAGIHQWHSIIELPVVGADLVADSVAVYNAGENGIFDPGESVNIGIVLRNDGASEAIDANGILVSQNDFVTVVDSSGSWGDIPAGGTAENNADLFEVTASPDAYEGIRDGRPDRSGQLRLLRVRQHGHLLRGSTDL